MGKWAREVVPWCTHHLARMHTLSFFQQLVLIRIDWDNDDNDTATNDDDCDNLSSIQNSHPQRREHWVWPNGQTVPVTTMVCFWDGTMTTTPHWTMRTMTSLNEDDNRQPRSHPPNFDDVNMGCGH